MKPVRSKTSRVETLNQNDISTARRSSARTPAALCRDAAPRGGTGGSSNDLWPRLPWLASLLYAMAAPVLAPAAAAGEPPPVPPAWALGPFVKHKEPVLRPAPESTFTCPVLGKEVRWEEQNVYNPAAVVRDGKVYLFYRADDKNPALSWGRTCRIGMAWSEDGINFTRHPAPVVFPDNDAWKEHEWEGGCEDLHIVEDEDGTAYMNYTTWNGRGDTISIASSRDLLHWKKHGPAFAKAGAIGGRSGVVVSRLAGDRLVAAKIDGKYWMYYTHPCALAWSENLIDWTPTGHAVWPGGGREAGAIALLGDNGILLMTQGGHHSLGAWVLRQALIDRRDLKKVLEEEREPFLYPEYDWEKHGFTGATTVANALVPFKGAWRLYYGAADRCVGLAVCSPKAGSPFSLPPTTGSRDVFERAKDELHRAVRDGRIAGAAHLVVRNGKTLYSEAAGFGDIGERTPFTADSILRIYSMSKPIASVAAMALFEHGKFGLDDPVARFIPAFTNATVLETVDGKPRRVPPKRPITVRDVVRHTTGYSYGEEPPVREFYRDAGLCYGGPQGLFPPRMTIAQAADALARVPALHHPGEKFTYGFSTDLLGRLIEIWSGEPLDRYLQRAVFEPLEMADTGFRVPPEKRHRFVACHLLSEGTLAVLDRAASSPFNDGFEFLSGGGGLVSTVRDYANFCQMLVDGGQFKGRRLLKPETLRLMFTDQLHGVDGANRFGIGFGIDDVELGSGAGQRKATCYRWGGYASTQFAVVPEERLFQIFALQQLPYTEELAKKQFAIIYAGLSPLANAAAPAKAAGEFANSPQVRGSNAADGQVAEPAYPLPPSVDTHGPSGGSADSIQWNQFRGPNGQGVAPASRVPIRFGPETNVSWKLAIPPGHSSPVIGGDLLFLTATEATDRQALLTLAIDRRDGRILWQREVRSEHQGVFHQLNNPASSTPAADARRVYAYFGTYGLLCYDHAGNQVWQRRLDTPRSKYGMATSPILYRDTVILVQDGDDGRSRLLAVHKGSGETAWEQPRALFKAGWSTPMIFRHGAVEDLIVLGSRRLTAYDPASGQERWWAGGFPEETVGVPVAGDGLLFASGAALGGRGDDDLDASATWKLTVEEFDRNRDGRIQRDEMTPGFAFIQRPELPRDNPGYGLPVTDMDVLLKIFDHDRDGVIAEAEWMRTMAGFAAISHPTLMALRPGAAGDARPVQAAWELRRGIPETSSLLCCAGRLYLMRDGGMLTCLEAATGRELFRERIGAPGHYTASPIAAGDRLLVASAKGVVTVIQIADTLTVLARQDLGEGIYATPAPAGDRLYVRTVKHLYAFGP